MKKNLISKNDSLLSCFFFTFLIKKYIISTSKKEGILVVVFMDDVFERISEKFEIGVFKSLNTDNLKRIISFLQSRGVDYIDELIDCYLDLFTIEYDEFVLRFSKLEEKYTDNLVKLISEDLTILEEF